MKIRWKILLILLTFSLAPLFVLKTHGLNSLKELGSDLQAQIRITLLERATDSLSKQAKGTAAMINLEDRLYRTTLKSVQGEADIRLNDDDYPPLETKPFITTPEGALNTPELINDPSYKKRALMGRGMNRSEHRMAAIQRGDLIDLPISLEHVSFWLAQGLTPEQAMPDITRLAPLLSAFKACSSTLKNLALWQEVILENGLVATYPGHNSFPHKYDPRTHSWYNDIKKNRETTWAMPTPDAASRTLCYRLSAPILSNSGRFLGVASLVVPVGATLNNTLIAGNNGKTEIMMVSSADVQSRNGALMVVGKVGDDPLYEAPHTMGGRFWLAPQEPQWLHEDNPEFRTMIKDIGKAESGVIQIKYKGVPSLWTYSPINSHLSLLIITPVRDFTAEADEAEQYVRESIANQYEGTSVIAFFVICAIAVVAYFASMSFSRPISKLSKAVIKVGEGDWDVRADFHSKDELGELAEKFNNMVPQLKEHSITQQALSLADEAQQSLFPQGPPTVNGADIGARCTFSEKTGGDYYDFLSCAQCDGTDRFGAAIGDVSGHGVSAALLMTSARAYIRALTGQHLSLVEVFERVNRLVTTDCAKTGHFMTAFTVICDTKEKTVNWIRAGHDPALIYTPESDSFEELVGTGLALGVDGEYRYEENLTRVEPGQILILYTDGIWEAHSPAGATFGKDNLRRIICENSHKPAQDMVDMLLAEVQNHRRGLPLEDDCTAIIIKFL
ncbi:SpoIIE family protein phosphatase [Maridesulfovibrio sp.]|uniref:SpoIIE family protein phosphatase n=1 Tax=Maridesulfovibrio sp. TaxID=2795000 RepID=UPI002A18DEAF|nr:SpoIIE family protein phosphatase [Maridesulfovibrio sp.]